MVNITPIRKFLKPGLFNLFFGYSLIFCVLLAYADDTISQFDSLSVIKKESKERDYIKESKDILEKNFSNKTREELYREIFGITPPAPPKQIEATIKVNNKTGSKVTVNFSDNRQNFSIPAEPVISILSDHIDDSKLKTIVSKIDNSGRISKRDLDSSGLFTEFDSNEYLVTIFVPPKLRTKQVHQLKYSRQKPYLFQSIKPSKFSGYLNVNATQQLRYLQNLSDDSSYSGYYKFYGSNDNIRQPLYCNFDGAIDILGAVTEGTAVYREGKSHYFRRNNVRIVYDFPRNALRLSAGDINYAVCGYQTHVTLGGVSLSKDYSLQPHVLSYPVGEHEFYLVDPAEVEVWVNGVMVRKMVLESGTHNIQNYPFVDGANEVQIVIRDFSGRTETIDFTFLYEPQLLAKNFSQYSLNLGFPSTKTQSGYNYNTENPFISLMYRRGLTNRFTIDTYGQAFRDKGIIGTECLYANSLGNLSFSSAVTYVKTLGVDMSAGLGFHYRSKIRYSEDETVSSNKRHIPSVSWKTEAEYIGRKFPEKLTDSIRFYDESFRLSSRLSIPLDQIGINADAEYNIRPDTIDYFEFGFNVQKRWVGKLSTRAGFRYSTDTRLNTANPSVMLSIQYSFMKASNMLNINQSVNKRNPLNNETFSTDNNSDRRWDYTTEVNWDYVGLKPKPERPVMGISARINPQYSEYRGKLGYSGNTGSMEINQILAEPGFASNTFLQHHTNINLKTALVFAEGSFALSCPVHGGFLIARGVKSLKGHKIRINQRNNGYDATSTWLTPAVLPLYSQYQLKDVNISSVDAPLSAADEKQKYTLFPQYKSGFLISVGDEKKILVTGRIINSDKDTLGYQQVKFIENADKDIDTVVTFTSQAGKFQFLAKVGKTYSVKIADEEYKTGTVKVPQKSQDFYRAEDIILKRKSEQDYTETEKTELNLTDSSADRNFSENNNDVSNEKDSLNSKQKITGEDTLIGEDTDTTLENSQIKKEAIDNLNDPLGRNVYISGVLRSSQGVLENAAFKVEMADNESFNRIQSFTDKFGKFQFILNRAGRYILRSKIVNEYGDSIYGFARINIPDKKMGTLFQLEEVLLDIDEYELSDIQDDSLSKDKIMVSGKVTDPNGDPLRLTRIMFSSLDTTLHTFTDYNGNFRTICNRPGMYIVCEAGLNKKKNIIIKIPENTKGHYDLGILKLKPGN